MWAEKSDGTRQRDCATALPPVGEERAEARESICERRLVRKGVPGCRAEASELRRYGAQRRSVICRTLSLKAATHASNPVYEVPVFGSCHT